MLPRMMCLSHLCPRLARTAIVLGLALAIAAPALALAPAQVPRKGAPKVAARPVQKTPPKAATAPRPAQKQAAKAVRKAVAKAPAKAAPLSVRTPPRPLPAPPRPGAGTLEVRTEPPGATLVIGGREAGKTPIVLDKLSAGEHAYELRFAQRARVRGKWTIEPGQTRRVTETLEPLPGGPKPALLPAQKPEPQVAPKIASKPAPQPRIQMDSREDGARGEKLIGAPTSDATAEKIEAMCRENAPVLRGCAKLYAGGSVFVFTGTVTATGRVASVRATILDDVRPELASCVAARLANVTFGAQSRPKPFKCEVD